MASIQTPEREKVCGVECVWCGVCVVWSGYAHIPHECRCHTQVSTDGSKIERSDSCYESLHPTILDSVPRVGRMVTRLILQGKQTLNL